MKSSPDASAVRVAPALTLAGVAALLASTCCVVPLVFAIAGVSGSWIAHLRSMEPYSTALTIVAAVSLGIAGWRIYGTKDGCASCQPGSATRMWFWSLAALTILPLAVALAAPLFY